MMKLMKTLIQKGLIQYLLFWSWNIVFATYTCFALIPEIWKAVFYSRSGIASIPFHFQIFAYLILIIPFICMTLGITIFRKNPNLLMRLFYGVQSPLIILGVTRLILFREINPGVAHVYLVLMGGILFYGIEIFFTHYKLELEWIKIRYLGHLVLVIGGGYLVLSIVFFAIPVAYELIKFFIHFEWIKILIQEFQSTLSTFDFFVGVFNLFVLLIFTSSLFATLPFVIPILYSISIRNTYRNFRRIHSVNLAWALLAGMILMNAGIFYWANQQPQQTVFQKLEEEEFSEDEKKEILLQETTLKKGLLNAYLSPYRYVTSEKESMMIEDLYRKTFNLSASTSQKIQRAFNFLATPFLYNGKSMGEDVEKAEKLYKRIFDTPIQKGEREEIQKALHASWTEIRNTADLLNKDKKSVFVEEQNIKHQDQGDWAEIEISELYQNEEISASEVFYSFSLPANAVMTGLWLSDDPAKDKKDVFQISPRGAAQKIYRQEVDQGSDPALLEQTGPRQYRLRIFPIPRKGLEDEKKPLKMRVWFSYKVLRSEENTWPLPQLLEKRNAFFTEKTRRFINGQGFHLPSDQWLPRQLKAEGMRARMTHWIALDETRQIEVKPLAISIPPVKNLSFAILVDDSFSMNERRNELIKTLEPLWKDDRFHENHFDLHLGDLVLKDIFNSNPQKTFDLLQAHTFFGSKSLSEIIHRYEIQALKQAAGKAYEAVFLLTDQGSEDLASPSSSPFIIQSPLWFIHLGNEFPGAYEDGIFDLIQKTRGGVETNFEKAWNQQQIQAYYAHEDQVLSTENGYLWSLSPSSATPVIHSGFSSLAIKQYLLSALFQLPDRQRETLRPLHNLAVQEKIVTPVSSMIVLINENQKKRLKEAESQGDAFDRQFEDGNKFLPKPDNVFSVNGTPEPEEWMLMGIAGIFLIYGMWVRKKKIFKVI